MGTQWRGGETDDDSIPWYRLRAFASRKVRANKLARPVRTRKPSWRARIEGHGLYSEMWLRYYARMRHFHSCFTMASDYANHMTRSRRPLVRTKDLDLKLLCAHAELVKGEINIKQTKGQKV